MHNRLKLSSFRACDLFAKCIIGVSSKAVAARSAVHASPTGHGSRPTRVIDACGHVHEHRHARSIAVRALVIRSRTVQHQREQRQRRAHQSNSRNHVDDDKPNAAKAHQAPEEEQHRQRHHAAQGHPLQNRKQAKQRAGKLLAHLAGIVVSHQHDLAAAGPARRALNCRLVLCHDILADALVEETRDYGTVKRLGREKQRHDQRDDERWNSHQGHDHRNDGHQNGKARAQRLRDVAIGVAVEILDGGAQPSLLLQALGNVERGLLLFLGSRRSRADVLR